PTPRRVERSMCSRSHDPRGRQDAHSRPRTRSAARRTLHVLPPAVQRVAQLCGSILLLSALLTSGCDREDRLVGELRSATGAPVGGPPGHAESAADARGYGYEENAYAVAEGKR